MNHFAIEPTVK